MSLMLLPLFCLIISNINALPTNYEYFTSDGISSGLSADQPYFILNGLNTIETYVPWNLHEPYSGVYDFGNGGSDMEDFLHLEEFLKTAQEENLFVIVRSGPYICSEFTFGGLPAWLLREKPIGLRTNEPIFLKYVERYFSILFPILKDFQFTKGGPVIAFQVENEYGYTWGEGYIPEPEYLLKLCQIFLDNGIVELLVTADGILQTGVAGSIPGVLLQTANFGSDPDGQLNRLMELQPDRPVMAMEFWIGWFDYWSADHTTVAVDLARDLYERVLKFPASVNIYMFTGGTNFGFLSGGGQSNSLLDNSGFEPIVTSYDYDSPISEAGDYTDKYFIVKELLEQYDTVKTQKPDLPDLAPKVAYPSVTINTQFPFKDLLKDSAPYVIDSQNLISMEMLDINNGSGQNFGYIVYRKENIDLEPNTVLKIGGHICDTVIVLVDGVLASPVLQSKADLDNFGYWRLRESTLVLNTETINNATLDIIVEEWGRMNMGTILQYNKTFKGLWQGDVYLNDNKVSDWKIIPLEFKKNWTNNLNGWVNKTSNDLPGLFHANLEIRTESSDTFLDMRKWTKGLVIVNGFPLGKYAKIGPQQTLYLPAPLLKTGSNEIVILEHFKADDELSFITKHIWSTV